MRLHGIDISPVEKVLVGGRIVLLNTLNELILAHHEPSHSLALVAKGAVALLAGIRILDHRE
jgi:hypothetical protein